VFFRKDVCSVDSPPLTPPLPLSYSRKSSLQDAPQGADWDHSDSFYQLPIPRSQVHFLGAVEDLQAAREVLCKVIARLRIP